MRGVFILSLFFSYCSCYWGKDVSGDDVSAILNNLTTGYDKRIRPNYGGRPVTVGVTLYILTMKEFSETNMDFTFQMYFRQFWQDPRLAFEKRLLR